MTDLIWVGNTLYPRWIVFAALAGCVLIAIGIWVALTDESNSPTKDRSEKDGQ